MKTLFRKLLVDTFALSILVAVVSSFLFGQSYTDLHDFNCSSDGCGWLYPGILAQGRDGNLYGTLPVGGVSNKGTVFKITPSGTMTTLHNFAGTDGSQPYSGLTLGTDGNFYGTTNTGGAHNVGTIFKITPAGALTTLHDFTGSDGANPFGPPVQGSGSTFYGVTYSGTAYSISSAGIFKLLSSSIPGSSVAPLLFAGDGNFYGTTWQGGAHGVGTVFRMSATGTVKTLYDFDGTHGIAPYGPVVQGSGGFLYGTTSRGGSSQVGVAFKLSTGGAITLLYQFDPSMADGYSQSPGLVAATDGKFYGVTNLSVLGGPDYGTLFKLTQNGAFSRLHTFDQAHGAIQYATGRQHTNGILYGLTSWGGAHSGGVFYGLEVGISPFVSLMTTSGTPGQTIEILGQGFTGTTGVKFGAGSASFTVVSDTYMTAKVPATGTTGHVTVTTPSGTLTSSQIFKVIPTISSFSPTSGPVGTQVVIKGTGLRPTTKVTFGDVTAAFVVNSATQVTATVPTAVITSKITITTPGGVATSSGMFTVTNSLPGRCVVSNGKMTGYCVGVRSGVCREAFDPTNCPQGQSVTNVVLDQCAQSTFTVDGSKACIP